MNKTQRFWKYEEIQSELNNILDSQDEKKT
jgi:hypothetical protein